MRPPEEVKALMSLFRVYLRSETAKCVENRIRLEIIGRRDRLSASLRADIEAAQEATRRATAEECRLLLRVAIDYSSRDAILRAVQRIGSGREITRELFSAMLADPEHTGPSPDVDLLIRTGGERRLSDFLLWECAYAEFYFTQRMWPDFAEADFAEAIADFRSRERRFGSVNATAAS
jgi:undecaprenyl diphosphate synthase